MNRETFIKILDGGLMLYDANQPYFVKTKLGLSGIELQLAMKVFQMLRFENTELKQEGEQNGYA